MPQVAGGVDRGPEGPEGWGRANLGAVAFLPVEGRRTNDGSEVQGSRHAGGSVLTHTSDISTCWTREGLELEPG